MGKQVYGPDNGWYYRLDDNDAIERAYPSGGRAWESVARNSVAYSAILDAVYGSGAYRGRRLSESSEKAVKAALKSAKKASKRGSDTVPGFTPSPYTPPSSSTYEPPASRRQGGRKGGSDDNDTLKLVGIGVGGLLAVGGLLYTLNAMSKG
jgi:hypothetical protein